MHGVIRKVQFHSFACSCPILLIPFVEDKWLLDNEVIKGTLGWSVVLILYPGCTLTFSANLPPFFKIMFAFGLENSNDKEGGGPI